MTRGPLHYPKLRPASRSTKEVPDATAAKDEDRAPPPTAPPQQPEPSLEPSLNPYVGRLERFELFSTNQCYYVVGSNKSSDAYRIIKIDRSLIERQEPTPQGGPTVATAAAAAKVPAGADGDHLHMAESSHTAKQTLRPLSDFVTEDPNVYTQEEIKDMLDMIHDGNRMARKNMVPGDPSTSAGGGGGLKPIVKAYGLVGFIRFLDCYYLTLITKRAKVGSIGGNGIYTIKNTETIPLKPSEQNPVSDELDPSSVLLSMWNRGKRSVGLGLSNREMSEMRYQGLYQVIDLSKNFFFSYTYDLTRSLQENFLTNTTKPFPPPPLKDFFAWNYFLTKEFEGCLNSMTSFNWIMPIIHGAYNQRKIHDYGRSLNLMLIARRSRHFAGTRYLKRGVSEQGKVANDVEHEQILHDESTSGASGTFSSYMQVRGSIPIFWTQESSMTMPKPPIELNRVDPTYHATRLHFEDLFKRYGSPQLVLDLVKQSEKREREVRVGNEYRHAIDYINSTIDDERHRIRMCCLDYSHTSKHRQLDVSSSLGEVSTWAVNSTGFFCSHPKWKITKDGTVEPFTEKDTHASQELSEKLGVPVFPMEQSGVLRTNCIDCLDRTNVAQFSAGVEAISQQLVVMGIRSQSKLDPSSNIVRVAIDMYVDIGDSVALQYGGSEAHKKVTAARSESNIIPIGKHKELLTSIRRYYSNAFTDRFKQDAMNLFLGHYIPYLNETPLWELETDYYLHNFHVRSGRGTICSMNSFRRAFGIDSREFVSDKGNRKIVGDAAKEDENSRIAKVRQRVETQGEALSIWWKVALQTNLQQRMWMKLGQLGPTESFLPAKYERLYQPDKIAQFDRFFARGWATPLRRSHVAQHTDGTEVDLEGSTLTRSLNPHRRPSAKNDDSRGTSEERRLSSVKALPLHTPVSLSSLVDDHDKRVPSTRFRNEFLGNLDITIGSVPEEYQRYCAPSKDYVAPSANREKAAAEFKMRLHDTSLGADDVDGIRKLSESAHVSRTVLEGRYRGLDRDHSAVEVATALHEQFNGVEKSSWAARKLIDTELKRRGLDALGVQQSVDEAWTRFCSSEKQYTEIAESSLSSHGRSDLTTPATYKLYTSYFDESTPLGTPDLIFLTGERQVQANDPAHKLLDTEASPAFAKKASRLGIAVKPHQGTRPSSDSPLFPLHLRSRVSGGFEQINDDMFCRKENKFMVLNGAAVDSWFGTQPTTKVFQSEDVYLND